MIRAFILYLLGTTFEVRLINSKTGKDIPGRCMYKGGYWKARRVYRKKHLKYGYVLRLQAVVVLDHQINSTRTLEDGPPTEHKPLFDPPKPMTLEEAQSRQNYIANKRLDNIKTAMTPPDFDEKLEAAGKRLNEPHGIGASNAAQSESFEQDPGAAHEAYQGYDKDDHDCDSSGPMDWSFEANEYVATCMVCGELQLKNVADSGNLAEQS